MNSVAEEKKESWLNYLALTTVIFAVCATLSTFKGGSFSTRSVMSQSQASDQWAYYQAKSIKQNLAESQKNAFEVEALGAASDEQKTLYANKLKIATDEISRYDSEKNQIRKEAEDTAALNKLIAKKGNFFSGSVVFFQLGIMLSSVSALLKRKFMWVIGLVFGAVAIRNGAMP